jgi:hypothetical protein
VVDDPEIPCFREVVSEPNDPAPFVFSEVMPGVDLRNQVFPELLVPANERRGRSREPAPSRPIGRPIEVF